MNKSESKYFATAQKMDEAFLKLLERKDLEYITVKELCALAGVNRSTFYLHYETIHDLLLESVEYINKHFLSYMNGNTEVFATKMKDCTLEELYLITPEYLIPYLSYIKEHQRLFYTALEHSAILKMNDNYERMFRYIFTPILDRYGVTDKDRPYIMTFYIHGIMAIISQWLKTDCKDSIEYVVKIIQQCVKQRKEET